MPNRDFYLLVTNEVLASYFVTLAVELLGGSPHFLGVLVGEEPPSDDVVQQRAAFHQEHAGTTTVTDELCRQWAEASYLEWDDTEIEMVRRFGVPRLGHGHHPRTIYIGEQLNHPRNRDWLRAKHGDQSPWIFAYVPKILRPWWMEITGSRITGSHSAVLPYARGIYALENVAALEDIDAFRRAAGASVFFINAGVDTGPLIRASRILDPFQFSSLWDAKGFIYMFGLKLYLEVMESVVRDDCAVPVGIDQDPSKLGPVYRYSDFTDAKREAAAQGYLNMKRRLSLE